MEKELCPQCKSEQTVYNDSGIYGGYWVCHNHGCDGKLANDKFYWKPGQGLPPKVPKAKKAPSDKAVEA